MALESHQTPQASTSNAASKNKARNPQQRRTHIALRGVFPKRSTKPCIEPDGLGVVERVFYNIKPGKPQVIMGCAIRLRNPAIVPHIPPERLLDLIKIAAAEHYRLCITIDPQTLRGKHLADTAADLPITYRVVEREKDDTWQEIVMEDINTNFDLKDTSKPLWRVSIVVPTRLNNSSDGDTSPSHHHQESPISTTDTHIADTPHLPGSSINHNSTTYLPPINGDVHDSDATTTTATIVNPHNESPEDNIEMSDLKGKAAADPSSAAQTTDILTMTNTEHTAANSSSTGIDAPPNRRGLGRPELSHSLSRFFSAPAGLTLPSLPQIHMPTIPHQSRQWTVGSWKVEWPEGQPFPRLVRVNPEENIEIQPQPEPPADGDFVQLLFTFNHVLGDGLSMWAFLRSFFDAATPERLSPDVPLNLRDFPCEKTPPPLIDNLLRPNFIEITPIVFGMLRRFITRRSHHRFKGRTKSNLAGLTLAAEGGSAGRNVITNASNENIVTSDNVNWANLNNDKNATTANDQNNHNTTRNYSIKHSQTFPVSRRVPLAEEADERIELGPEMASPLDPLGPPAEPLFSLPIAGKTRARFLSLDHDFTEAIRKKCNREKTTVAAAVVVAALAAVRTLSETMPAYTSGKRSLPARQGWVVTSSVRHLLPNHTSLYGGERADDPSLKIFGGYGGSIFNNNLRFVDSHDFWERCRRVKRDIRLSYRTSIMRMKLVNWCFRHQSVWEWVNKRANLSKLSRAYTVELANLGAWDSPCALPGVGESDPRFRLDGFSGILNSSFDGVRGLFCIGTMSISGAMSITIAYDVGAVLEQDADLFVSAFLGALHRAVKAPGKVTVEKARIDDGTIARPIVIHGHVVIDESTYSSSERMGIHESLAPDDAPAQQHSPTQQNGSVDNVASEKQPAAPVSTSSK